MKKKIRINWLRWLPRLICLGIIAYGIWDYNKTTFLIENGVQTTATIKECNQYYHEVHYLIMEIEYDGYVGELRWLNKPGHKNNVNLC
ncbi:MAG: hypothetical protein GY810_30510 [Aureispira sp.]|nr:hypothetical protein [Aureispira sp.]